MKFLSKKLASLAAVAVLGGAFASAASATPVFTGNLISGGPYGAPVAGGSASFDPTSLVYTVTGSGYTTTQSTSPTSWTDSGEFYSTVVSGDFSISAEFLNVNPSISGSVALTGLEARSSATGNNSTYLMAGLSPGAWYTTNYRSVTGGAYNQLSVSGSGSAVNTWFKLARVGNTLTSYMSSDGLTWTTMASFTDASVAAMNNVGFFIQSGWSTSTATLQAQNLTLTAPGVSSNSSGLPVPGPSVLGLLALGLAGLAFVPRLRRSA